jgi:hypothetical protein
MEDGYFDMSHRLAGRLDRVAAPAHLWIGPTKMPVEACGEGRDVPVFGRGSW